MALYVTVCLLAALTALQNVVAVSGRVLGLVWGTTIGLALAHLFAFELPAALFRTGGSPRAIKSPRGSS
jgi:tetrahydromethanopterin S-methyltransferase subunit B